MRECCTKHYTDDVSRQSIGMKRKSSAVKLIIPTPVKHGEISTKKEGRESLDSGNDAKLDNQGSLPKSLISSCTNFQEEHHSSISS